MQFHLEYPRRGVYLFWGDTKFFTDFIREFSIEEGFLAFSTIMSGYLEYSLVPSRRGKRKVPTVSIHPCDLVLSSCDCEGNAHMYSGDPYRFVSIILSPSALEEMLPSSCFPASTMHSLTKFGKGINIYKMSKLNTQLRTVSEQILSCSMDGVCRSLFIEGKILEFLSLHIDKITIKNDTNLPFTKSDIDKLYIAKNILIDNILNPPTIHNLSIQCGLNEFKLKNGFNIYFGNTVYGFLRKERMRLAFNLLRDSDTSVNIVADNIGYSNTSHFIAAFRNEFGVNPGEILKKGRRRMKNHIDETLCHTQHHPLWR